MGQECSSIREKSGEVINSVFCNEKRQRSDMNFSMSFSKTSSKLKQLLGNVFVDKNGVQFDTSVFAGKRVIGLYFGANWCGPCQQFVTTLVIAYKLMKQMHGQFEIVFVSSDQDEDGFNRYMGSMPWIALPFADRDRKAELSRKYGVEGIPTLVLLDADGNFISNKGRAIVTTFPEDFPWTKRNLIETMGSYLMRADGTTVRAMDVLQGKVVAFFFSSSDVQDHDMLLPLMIKTYENVKQQQRAFEIVFVSKDVKQQNFTSQFGMMPWYAIPYSEEKIRSYLEIFFNWRGGPMLAIVDTDLETIINSNALNEVLNDAEAARFPWAQELVEDLSVKPAMTTLEQFAIKPMLLAFLEGCPPEEQSRAKATMNAAAKKMAAVEMKNFGTTKYIFSYCGSQCEAGDILRAITGMLEPTISPTIMLLFGQSYYLMLEPIVDENAIIDFLAAFEADTLPKRTMQLSN